MRHLRRLLAALVCGQALVVAGAAQGATTPVPADAFVESVGINVHLSYSDTVYGDRARVLAALGQLGLRHIRDGLLPGRPDQYAALRALAANGVRANLILGDPSGRFGTVEQLVPTVERDLAGVIASLEGANEYDLVGDPNWVAALRDYQRRLYERVKASPVLRALPVLAPALARNASFDALGSLAAWVDVGNAHPYPAGRPVTTEHVLTQIALARRVAPGKPLTATETGYHNTQAATPDHPSVSERAAAIDVPKLYLEHFAAGVARTYLYELIDVRRDGADSGANFGLLRNDWSPKPAFVALRNLVALFSEPGGGAPPAGALDFTLGGDSAGVRHLLFRKRDGTFLIALWHSPTVFDTRARRDLVPAERAVTVDFGGVQGHVRAFRPTLSATPVAQYAKTRSVTVALPADPLVLEVQPPSAAAIVPAKAPAAAKRPKQKRRRVSACEAERSTQAARIRRRARQSRRSSLTLLRGLAATSAAWRRATCPKARRRARAKAERKKRTTATATAQGKVRSPRMT